MRKICLLILCLCLAVPVSAAEGTPRKYLALTIEDPSGPQLRYLLGELSRRKARVTFFFQGEQLARDPELAELLLEGGHEIGIIESCRREQAPLSRRQIAADLSRDLTLLPEKCRVRFIRPHGKSRSQSLQQVARVMGFSLLERPASLRDWASRDGTAMAGSLLNRLRDGDILAMDLQSASDAHVVLNTLDFLSKQGFHFVTASELARIRQIRLFPGVCYRSFSRKEAGEIQ